MANYEQLMDILKKYKQELPGSNDQEKDSYLEMIKAKLSSTNKKREITNEDKKLACQIAVDTSKSLVQVAIAVIVAIGGFITYGFDNNWRGTSIVFLVIAAFLTFGSMIFGFTFISKIYKQGEGRINNTIQWSTESVKTYINLQAYLGIAALIAFGLAIYFSLNNFDLVDPFICL